MKQFLLSIFVAIWMVACGERPASEGYAAESAPAAEAAVASAPMGKMAADNMAEGVGAAEQSLTEISEPELGSAAQRKYIALRHHLQIETPADQMQAAFDAAVAHCAALNCQLLSANYNKETSYNPPSASLSVRVPPRNIEIFFLSYRLSIFI